MPTWPFLQPSVNSFLGWAGRRWSLQKGFVPLPKSASPERQRENFAIFGFSIPEADMAQLDGLEEHLVTGWAPQESDPA
jgi:diketogulonate reductase-like aldo/keto reductase